AGAVDPFAVAERLRHRFAERDADVLDGVMLIDVEVTGCSEIEIESAVTREQLEHVVEKADAGPHAVAPGAVESQLQADLRFGRTATDQRAAHSTSSSTSMQRRVCSTTPVLMRRQPPQPGSVERSRR